MMLCRAAALALSIAWSTAAAADVSDPNNNSSLIWGPYRPNLYFGVRPRIPKTLLMGLMWARIDGDHMVENDLRHTCEQSDGMAGYGWTAYDPRSGGSQTIHDTANLLDLTTEFFKDPGGPHGGNWGVRVKGFPRPGAPRSLKSTVIFYVAMEEMHSKPATALHCGSKAEPEAIGQTVTCKGTTPPLGGFKIHILPSSLPNSKTGTHPETTLVYSTTVPEEKIWQAKSVFLEQAKGKTYSQKRNYQENDVPASHSSEDRRSEGGEGNFHFVQNVFEGAFEFDILYSSDEATSTLNSKTLTDGIRHAISSFESRFDKVFVPQRPYNNYQFRNFSKEVLSNLLGGMGYFYGDSKVDLSYAPEYQEKDLKFWEKAASARQRHPPNSSAPMELFSFVPSRPFFPRGFLWDEGFHLRLIVDWDLDLALEVVKSWFSLMDENGWIAREQILGPEARSKVPPEFQVQYPHYANPPTLFLIIDKFVEIVSGEKPYSGLTSRYVAEPLAAKEYLTQLYPLLKRHYQWFRTTQSGDMESYERPKFLGTECYRWRGRTPQLTLTSGLDDYPRAQPPHPGELHLDAISWVGSMAKVLKKVASFLGEVDDQNKFTEQQEAIEHNIETLHWSEKEQAYCDATIENDIHTTVCHKGYVSLSPFFVGLLGEENPHLGAVLDLISRDTDLWSPYGLRSLSYRSPLYGTEENYWRSPIWLNINFLVLERLLELAQSPGTYQQKARMLYISLRSALSQTVYKSWSSTGFVWEQYNPRTGAGQRTQHFTGWSALIVKILAMPDMGEQGTNPGSPGPHANVWVLKELIWMMLFMAIVVIFRRKLLRLWRGLL